MIKKTAIILFLALAAQYAGRPQGAAPTGIAFADSYTQDGKLCPPECVSDSMEIVTWYPSPYNEYEELRLYPISDSNSQCNSDTRGLMYYDSDEDKVKLCKGPAGLNNWQDLGGGAYWDKSSSNSNDIYYAQSGNVGIGTNNPTQMLTVNGTVKLLSGGIQFPDGTIQTTSGIPTGYNWITDFGSAILLKNGVSISAYCLSCTAVGGEECGGINGYARNNNGVIQVRVASPSGGWGMTSGFDTGWVTGVTTSGSASTSFANISGTVTASSAGVKVSGTYNCSYYGRSGSTCSSAYTPW